MLFSGPEAREQIPQGKTFGLKAMIHWRPQSDDADAVVLLLYYVFALMVCYDSTWGTLMSAEWGVRAPAIPQRLFKQFLENQSKPSLDLWGSTSHAKTWGFHCLDNRMKYGGTKSEWAGCGTGVYEYESTDGFFTLGRTVQALFVASALYLYLTQGLCHCILCLVFYAQLLIRCERSLFHLLHATYQSNMVGPKNNTPSAEGTPSPSSML
jgi:hypothetical protein